MRVVNVAVGINLKEAHQHLQTGQQIMSWDINRHMVTYVVVDLRFQLVKVNVYKSLLICY
jgi:hypothetical protein